jgi:hypothetical protein
LPGLFTVLQKRTDQGKPSVTSDSAHLSAVLDPHVTGACVIILDEAAATALFDVLGTWLG